MFEKALNRSLFRPVYYMPWVGRLEEVLEEYKKVVRAVLFTKSNFLFRIAL